MKDGDIDYSDIPELDYSFYTKAPAAWPPGLNANSPFCVPLWRAIKFGLA